MIFYCLETEIPLSINKDIIAFVVLFISIDEFGFEHTFRTL